MQHPRLSAALALLGAGAGLAAVTTGGSAQAVTTPGRPLLDDYGQSPAEVTAEVKAAVAATPAVVSATSTLDYRHRVVLARVAAESTARTAYLAAVSSGSETRIATTLKAYLAARALTAQARSAEAAARTALSTVVASTTTAVRARHYLPVDGTWAGTVAQYFVPGVGLEPLQVRISVYEGHVSDVSVPVFTATGESGDYNARALPVLAQEAMAAHDTASVAVVTGASLTSTAFAASLQSALTKAGFKR